MELIIGLGLGAALFALFGVLTHRTGCAGCIHAQEGPCCGGRPREEVER